MLCRRVLLAQQGAQITLLQGRYTFTSRKPLDKLDSHGRIIDN